MNFYAKFMKKKKGGGCVFINNSSELYNISTVVIHSELPPAEIYEKPTVSLGGHLSEIRILEPAEMTELL